MALKTHPLPPPKTVIFEDKTVESVFETFVAQIDKEHRGRDTSENVLGNCQRICAINVPMNNSHTDNWMQVKVNASIKHP